MLLELLSSLHRYLDLDDPDFEEIIGIDEDLSGAILHLKALAIPAIFIEFLNFLAISINTNVDDFLNETYPGTGEIHIIDFTLPKLNNKNRAFAYSDNEFAFFSSKALFYSGSLLDFSNPQRGILWKQMQIFFERCYRSPVNLIDTFFDCLNTNDSTKGIVVKMIAGDFLDERDYSYIYLSFLNTSNSITLPANLIYSNSTLNSRLSYISAIEYEQYFDIYDVLNELNQAPDLLTRFLKLYHVLEYFIYRVYLVELVNKVGRNKFFVREFINTSETMKKAEREAFINNFIKIFADDTIFIIAGLNPALVDPQTIVFLTEHDLVKNFDVNSTKKIAELIYGIRCSIVHNKESQYHLTVSLHDDFILIIPLIHKLIEIFETLIVEKISTDHLRLKYPQRELNLF